MFRNPASGERSRDPRRDMTEAESRLGWAICEKPLDRLNLTSHVREKALFFSPSGLQAGFTLIEIVISMLVLGIVALALTTFFGWVFGVFNYTNVLATEESLARSQLEFIKSQPWGDGVHFTSISSIPQGYVIYGNDSSDNATSLTTPRAVSFGELAGTSENVTGLSKVTVVVTRTYSSGSGVGRTVSVVINDYKVRR